MFETRAQQLGLVGRRSPKRLAARTNKSLTDLRRRIEKLSEPYAEIDESVVGSVAELMSEFDRFDEKIKEVQEFLNEEASY